MRSLYNNAKHATTAKKEPKRGELTTPIFLRKAFDMINTCDPSLASWSDDGTTFVIKEPELFASTVIPSYFKHANLSSFVRQLNFYGFRKIKSDPLRLCEAALSEESRYGKFGHRFFVQGREDLLVQIKKYKDNNEIFADKVNVDFIKKNSQELKRKLSDIEQDVEDLKASLPVLMRKVESANKKHQCSAAPIASTESSNSALDPTFFQNVTDTLELDDISFGCLDEALVLSPYESNEVLTDTVNSSTPSNPRTVALATRLSRALSRLPPGKQKVLVDRLVGLVCNPEELQRQIDVVTSLTLSSTKLELFSERHDGENDGNEEKRLVSLGSTSLDSFLSKDCDDDTSFSSRAGDLDIGYLDSFPSRRTPDKQCGAMIRPSVHSVMGL